MLHRHQSYDHMHIACATIESSSFNVIDMKRDEERVKRRNDHHYGWFIDIEFAAHVPSYTICSDRSCISSDSCLGNSTGGCSSRKGCITSTGGHKKRKSSINKGGMFSPLSSFALQDGQEKEKFTTSLFDDLSLKLLTAPIRNEKLDGEVFWSQAADIVDDVLSDISFSNQNKRKRF